MKTVTGICTLILFSLLIFSACGDTSDRETADELSEYDQFWQTLSHHCGNAYGGEITRKPEGADLFDGREYLVVHFRECDDEEEMRLPFHAQNLDDTWNRSRTWVLFHHGDQLELRHDHRNPDGTEEESTWYGAFSGDVVSANRTEFIRERSPDSDAPETGWRIEIEPDERYTYGTIRDGEWSWKLDFDLTEPIETPPAPWGFEGE